MDWTQVLVTIIGSGIGTTIIGLLFKQRFDSRLEEQRALLSRASRVHERQIDALSKLYEYLYKAQAFLQLMASPARFEGEKPEDYPKAFGEALMGARDVLLANRLLIASEIGQQCDALFTRLWEGRSELAWANHPAIGQGDERAQYWDNARKIAYKEIPPLLENIESSARSVIHGN